MSCLLSDPYDEEIHPNGSGALIDIDLSQSAFKNAQR